MTSNDEQNCDHFGCNDMYHIRRIKCDRWLHALSGRIEIDSEARAVKKQEQNSSCSAVV